MMMPVAWSTAPRAAMARSGFGGADQLVPVADSIRLFSDAACRYDRATLTVEVFPGAGHRIQVDASTRLAPGYLRTLAQWIKARADDGPGTLANAHRHGRAFPAE